MRQTGGHGQYGHVWLELEPMERNSGFKFVNKVVGGTIPREYVPAVEKGVKEALETGVLAGYPVIDVKATLVDGSFHPVDSSEIAFKMAGSIATKEGVKRAKPVLLEPILDVEVVTPEISWERSSAIWEVDAPASAVSKDRGRCRQFARWCRWRRPSGTPLTCDLLPREGQASQWSSATTKKCRKVWHVSWQRCSEIMPQQKIRIILRAFDHKILDVSALR